MKRWICVWVCLLLLLPVLSGCAARQDEADAPAKTEAPAEEAERPTEEPAPQSFGLAYVREYGLNPYSCTCITNRPILSLLYEGLFSLNSSYEAEPLLCDKLAVSDNGRTYVLTVRTDVRFTDGTALTAGDVVASLNAAAGSENYGSRFVQVAELYASDDRTVVISLYTPYENLPLLLDVPIVKASTVGDAVPVGTGPYRYSVRMLIRSERWWQDRAPAVDFQRIALDLCDNPTEVRDSFEFGSTSLVCADLNAPSAVGYRCDYELWDGPTTTMLYLGFNVSAGICADPVFRAGITHIVDREDIIRRYYRGFGTAACLPCAPGSPLYDDKLAAEYGYDESAFRAALHNSGIPAGYGGTILVCAADTTRVELAHALAETLNAYGLKLTVNAVDYNSFVNALNIGNFDLYIGEVRLPGNFDLSEFFKPYGLLGYGGVTNFQLNELCADALENSGNYYSLHKQIMDNGYLCPLLFKSYAIMANRGAVSNLHAGVDDVFHLQGGRTLADATVPYALIAPAEPESESESEPEANGYGDAAVE